MFACIGAVQGHGSCEGASVIGSDKVAKRHRKKSALGRVEGIKTRGFLHASDHDRPAERVEAAIEQRQSLGKGRKRNFVLLGYSLDGLNDRRSVRHALYLADCKRTHALSGAEKGPAMSRYGVAHY